MHLNELELTVIENCVSTDLQSIEKNDYDDIIRKMKYVSTSKLETMLQILNMGVIESIAKKHQKKKTAHNKLCIIDSVVRIER